MPKAAYPDFAKHKREMSRLKYYEQRFILSPERFRGPSIPGNLVWTTIKRFGPTQLASIVAKPGLYAFSVVNNRVGMPPHGYVLYVGQTGAKHNWRTLKQRASEYLKEKKTAKRQHVWDFLNKWSGHLSFHFAELDPATNDLEGVEKLLNDALIPPYVINDFTTVIKSKKKAWSLT